VSAFWRGAKTLEKLFCREQSQKFETRQAAKNAAKFLKDGMNCASKKSIADI
jgi:hypothetical protein